MWCTYLTNSIFCTEVDSLLHPLIRVLFIRWIGEILHQLAIAYELHWYYWKVEIRNEFHSTNDIDVEMNGPFSFEPRKYASNVPRPPARAARPATSYPLSDIKIDFASVLLLPDLWWTIVRFCFRWKRSTPLLPICFRVLNAMSAYCFRMNSRINCLIKKWTNQLQRIV